ncbi:hypothetical protein Cha6605_1925 [Chamaesiphon minutus PCC 6605]|uniref:Uncharacterized protein n=1 Tax=Chamaesiphon minutus (strain ATCC 27169 / PCC 6605) TaxID=1173020 RepID=K9UD43_CHAP6|nr:hypothetical protein Cha6605_1925 [Chamaesiphon minutus PCC 6605]
MTTLTLLSVIYHTTKDAHADNERFDDRTTE